MEGYSYVAVGASEVSFALTGSTKAGAKHDYLHNLTLVVDTAASSTVTLIDGTTSIPLLPINTPIGTYNIEMDMTSQTGPWRLTTAAGVTVVALGRFT